MHAGRLFLALRSGPSLSVADAARAPVRDGLEDALAGARAVDKMDGGAHRRIAQALNLCLFYGRSGLHRYSVALCIHPLRESAERTLVMRMRVAGLRREGTGDRAPRASAIDRHDRYRHYAGSRESDNRVPAC